MKIEISTKEYKLESLEEIDEKLKVSLEKGNLMSEIHNLKQSIRSNQTGIALETKKIDKKNAEYKLLFGSHCPIVFTLAKKLGSALEHFEVAKRIYGKELEEARESFSSQP